MYGFDSSEGLVKFLGERSDGVMRFEQGRLSEMARPK
jgi:hypothetical protein